VLDDIFITRLATRSLLPTHCFNDAEFCSLEHLMIESKLLLLNKQSGTQEGHSIKHTFGAHAQHTSCSYLRAVPDAAIAAVAPSGVEDKGWYYGRTLDSD
jgi:hypothetical protein